MSGQGMHVRLQQTALQLKAWTKLSLGPCQTPSPRAPHYPPPSEPPILITHITRLRMPCRGPGAFPQLCACQRAPRLPG